MWENRDGIFFAISTPGSNRTSEYYRELRNLIAERGMSEPDYLDYEVWFCGGLHFDNVHGFTEEQYTDSPLENNTLHAQKTKLNIEN